MGYPLVRIPYIKKEYYTITIKYQNNEIITLGKKISRKMAKLVKRSYRLVFNLRGAGKNYNPLEYLQSEKAKPTEYGPVSLSE